MTTPHPVRNMIEPDPVVVDILLDGLTEAKIEQQTPAWASPFATPEYRSAETVSHAARRHGLAMFAMGIVFGILLVVVIVAVVKASVGVGF